MTAKAARSACEGPFLRQQWALVGALGRAILLALCAAASAACTIERDVPASAFACSAGGPCTEADAAMGSPDADALADGGERADAEAPDTGAAPDGGLVPDGGLDPDAGLAPDAEPVDSGPPGDSGVPVGCAPATPLPASGIATGTTDPLADQHFPFCGSERGGHDVTYYFTTTTTVAALTARTAGSQFDTLLYAYRDTCRDMTEIDCSDDADGAITSLLELERLVPGTYYFVVDGFTDEEAGDYELTVAGTLDAGATCDPALPFLACAAGVCLPQAAGAPWRCQDGLDCADGFDTDGDGRPDEDNCVRPPVVSCPAPTTVSGLGPAPVRASATDDGQVLARRWSVTSTHAVEPQLRGAHTDLVELRPALAGRYRLRYQATDDLAQTSACETTVSVAPSADLHIELTWSSATLADLDLHLLEPTATHWFDELLDCDPFTCEQPLAWGAAGAIDDPRLRNGAAGPPGGERIEIITPRPGTYRVGVHYAAAVSTLAANAQLRVYCRGALVREQLAQLQPAVGSDFWKAADITVTAAGCTVAPLTAAGGGPLLVDTTDAEQAR